ncbi:MAG: sulfatase [Proteobacteria bacterium]|nr:sulfatase [Pseudomonadota bacterium]
MSTIVRAVLTLSLFVGVAGQAFAAEAPRLNILFMFADDWGRYASCYKGLDGRPTVNDVIQTPNVDRVAREGTLFKNAFVNAPSCTPCRSSLLSGRYFFQTGRGAILQGAVWDETIPTFPLLLRDSGYHIGKSFKVWSPGTPADAGFGGQQYAYQKAGSACNHFSEESTKMVAEGMTVEAARQKILDQVRGNFDDFLAARKPGQPWLYWMGTTTTHRPWVKGSGKKLWGIEPESLKGKLPKFVPDVPEVREDFADYLGVCQAVDAYVGVLMKRLEESGELERTVVVLSGDHGMPGVTSGKCNLYDHGTSVALIVRWPGGKTGRVVTDLVRLPDLMPTFLEIGGVKAPEKLYGKSLIPLFKSEQSGLVDASRDWVVTGRERHVGVAREGNLPYPMRGLRTPEFLYIRNFMPDRWPMGAPYTAAESSPDLKQVGNDTRAAFPDMDASPTKTWLIAHQHDAQWKSHFDLAFAKRPPEELYDVKNDPDQVKNLAADPAYATQKRALSERLMKLLTEANDPRVTGDGSTFDKPPFSDPERAGQGKAKQKVK